MFTHRIPTILKRHGLTNPHQASHALGVSYRAIRLYYQDSHRFPSELVFERLLAKGFVKSLDEVVQWKDSRL